MTILFNLLCKAFIAILDILLLDFYLKNVYPDIYHNKTIKTKYILYSFVFIGLIISSNSFSISGPHLVDNFNFYFTSLENFYTRLY